MGSTIDFDDHLSTKINRYISSAKMILSGFISDEDGISQGNDGKLFPVLDLCSSIEEADGRIIPHIAKAIQSGCKYVIVHSNMQMYWHLFCIICQTFLD